MILETIIILSMVSVFAELIILAKFKVIRNVLKKHPELTILFSIALSAVLGFLFGAHGLIVFAAAIISTVVIQPIYSISGAISRAREAKQLATAS